MLILLLCFYMLVGHWLACIWYSIGRADAESGYHYGWLWKLGNLTQVTSATISFFPLPVKSTLDLLAFASQIYFRPFRALSPPRNPLSLQMQFTRE